MLLDLYSSKRMPKKKTNSSLRKTKKVTKKKFKINQSIINKLVGLLFITVALFVLMFKLPVQKPIDKSPIVINSKLLESKQIENIPVRIIIPKTDIDLKVIPAQIVNGYWELSETTASYGLGSGHPKHASNTVIFAHARKGLFYNLKNVKTGDSIYVFTKNKWYRYKVNKITAVYPNETEVIQPTKKETLTLYTCTGFSDEKRLVVTAIPQN